MLNEPLAEVFKLTSSLVMPKCRTGEMKKEFTVSSSGKAKNKTIHKEHHTPKKEKQGKRH